MAASLGGLTQHVVMSHKDGTLVTTEIPWRGHWSVLMHVWPPPSGFQVGSSGNHVTLQAETYHPVPLQDVSTEGQVERSVGGSPLPVFRSVPFKVVSCCRLKQVILVLFKKVRKAWQIGQLVGRSWMTWVRFHRGYSSWRINNRPP